MYIQCGLVTVCGFLIVFIFVKYRKKFLDDDKSTENHDLKPAFDQLQYNFLCGSSAAYFADWLYGPYIYQLYIHYGYDSKLIYTLYMTGFTSSMCFGPLVGYFADAYGRKKLCLCYILFGILSSLCKISSAFEILFIGHVLTGICSSIQGSVFNAWYMHEHLERFHFPREWLNATFSTATFLNGVLAIVAGATADLIVEFCDGNPLAPYLLIVPVLIGTAVPISRWDENKGVVAVDKTSFFKSLNAIFHLGDFNLLLMGAVLSLMEASVYAFVMVWPPLLAGLAIPQGIVFAMLMTSLSLGAVAIRWFSSDNSSASNLLAALYIAAGSFVALALVHSAILHTSPPAFASLLPALMLEFSVGIYFPSYGSLLSVVVPESVRASVSNIYRLPMNLFMCGILLWSHQNGQQEFFPLFSACTIMTLLASGAGHLLQQSMKKASKSREEPEESSNKLCQPA